MDWTVFIHFFVKDSASMATLLEGKNMVGPLKNDQREFNCSTVSNYLTKDSLTNCTFLELYHRFFCCQKVLQNLGTL